MILLFWLASYMYLLQDLNTDYIILIQSLIIAFLLRDSQSEYKNIVSIYMIVNIFIQLAFNSIYPIYYLLITVGFSTFALIKYLHHNKGGG
jgi:hypothetical protein